MGSNYIKLEGNSYIPRADVEPTVTINPGFSGLTIRFQGNNYLYKVQGCFLSASTTSSLASSFDFYSNIKSISSKFHPFTAIPIDEYTVINNNILQINFPIINLSACNVDFIFTNPAGYSKASNSNRFTFVKITSG
jgi:hypothetical protein